MRISSYLSIAAIVFAAACPACSSSSDSTPPENEATEDSGGIDSATQDSTSGDSAVDSGAAETAIEDSAADVVINQQADAKTDVTPDSGADSSADTGIDSSGDSSTDSSATDSSVDSSADGPVDAGVDAKLDSGIVDSATEVSSDAADSSPVDAATCTPLSGLGKVTCPCGKPNAIEWMATTTPFYFDSHVDYGTAGWDPTQLTPGGQTIYSIPNAGGSSVESEAEAFDMLARCDFATLLKTETQITYTNSAGKKTDILVSIDGRKIGVSVVRAYHYPPADPYTSTDATTMLKHKLGDIPLSAANATAADAWERSILSVLAYDQATADMVKATWTTLDATLKGDVILYVTVTDGDDSKIY